MKISTRYGLILGGALAVLPLVSYALGMEKDETMQKVSSYMNIIIPCVVIFLGIREERTIEGKGFLSLGKGFTSGLMISIIGGVISSVFTYIYFTVLNPGMVTYIRMKQEEAMIERGMSEDEVAKMAGKLEFWSSPIMMTVFALLGMIIIGMVISLISAAILKKEDPSAEIS